jgi:transcriptional regulator NrdR family protein
MAGDAAGGEPVNCPACTHPDTNVIDTRSLATGERRRRVCAKCNHRFTTHEYTPEQLAAKIGSMIRDLRIDVLKLYSTLKRYGAMK